MDTDDPEKPEFANWQSYTHFAERVRRKRRYVWGVEENAFLDTVLATIRDRSGYLKQGTIFYRAQQGNDWRDVTDAEGKIVGPIYIVDPLTILAGQANYGHADQLGYIL